MRFDPSNCSVSRWLFLKLLALVYLIAFLSLWVQIDGLAGSNGILPADSFLKRVSEVVGVERYWRLPTLCWVNASDTMLNGLCAGGCLLAILLLADLAPALCLLLMWAFYLSLSSVCGDFLNFQWDALLLEAGFLTVFLAPLHIRPCRQVESAWSGAVVWLLRWLLFRLMFSSGAVKLASGDLGWRSLSALRYHYETQPLPTWIGWFAHQMPDWFQTLSVLIMFFIELVVPFFIFVPGILRRFAFFGFITLQLLIALTGNYCFFNLLAMALCVLLLSDLEWPERWRAWVEARRRRTEGPRILRWPAWVLVPVAAATVLVTGMLLLETLRWNMPWPRPLLALYRMVAPFRSTNSYGLFAIMTTERPEIIVEGSDDGERWVPYEFKWKPGDLNRRPGFVAPHQPRLDWQMWFAALGSYQEDRWFLEFLERVLKGSHPVLNLLQKNPFPNAPPRYVRAVVYNYRFTDWHTLRSQGTWWRREYGRLYCPVISLPP